MIASDGFAFLPDIADPDGPEASVDPKARVNADEEKAAGRARIRGPRAISACSGLGENVVRTCL